MELLERIWEGLGLFFGGILRGFERGITSIFGSSNARYIKKLQGRVDRINALEPRFQAMSDEELKAQTGLFRQRLANDEILEDLLEEAFAACREAGVRFLGMRHYDVQLIGGMVLHSGAIAEMVTGEGKTLVATLPAYLNALDGKGVHVVTVNDYLARRDMEWMAPLYMGLGLSVGAIQSDMEVDERQHAYSCDITYGTNNEFGFDYLRDNMRPAARGDDRFPKPHQQSQGPLHYAIVDEVDNILIDEARTPLIISGPAHDNVQKYSEADKIARQLVKDRDFEVNEKDHTATLTDEGIRRAEKLADVESFYTAGNMDWPHLIDNALKAHHLYRRDVNYVVKEGRVVIVDEFTGRLMEGRQWSDGLHQAVEAKEGVKVKEETQTLATITLQNFFKLYRKISGMTGTAMTEANEFWKIYKLDVVAIPTNRPMQRLEHPDVIYRTEREKFHAVADEIERLNRWDTVKLKSGEEAAGDVLSEDAQQVVLRNRDSRAQQTISRDKVIAVQRKGRPVLVGTVSIEKSERLSRLLEQRGVKHEVLNAKYHKREAEIVAQAGRKGSVTIATNMAGRGTDIVLGGNPETMAWARLQDKYATRLDVPQDEWNALVEEIDRQERMSAEGEVVKSIGGLHVIGTERHDARRIDLQLRGRCGRQGDPGSSRFFLSLEDDLMRIFASAWVKTVMEKIGGMQEGDYIESRMVSNRIEAAQKKREEFNFEARKNLLEYDEVMDEQRKRVYRFRQDILEGVSCREVIVKMIREQVDQQLETLLDRNYGVDSFAAYAGSKLAAQLEGRDFRGLDFQGAADLACDQAERQAESNVMGAIDENLPSEDDTDDWNWGALAVFANQSWGLNLRDRDLKKVGRERVDEFLLEEARKAIGLVDLSEGKEMLEPHYSLQQALAWVRNKFGLELSPDELQDLPTSELKDLVCQKAAEAYDLKESQYPVMAGLYRFSQGSGPQRRIDRGALLAWAGERFGVEIHEEDFRNKQRDEIVELLVECSRQSQLHAEEALKEIEQKVHELFGDADDTETLQRASGGNGALDSLTLWIKESLHCELPPDQLAEMNSEQLRRTLSTAVEDRYRPEMRRMERSLLLQIVDSAWKDHLLAMDHLRSSVGLAGYAQMDPKVEYKREGMKLFEQMWESIAERTTDYVFRIEQLDEGFVGSTWVETRAVHESPDSLSDMTAQQQQAIENSQGEGRLDPIRYRTDRVGRNDPCPCGSGRKYKACCLRKRA